MARHVLRAVGVVLGLALITGGCGGRASVAGAGVAGPIGAAFRELPGFPGAEPAGTDTKDGGAVRRSFRATGTTPQAVMDFYGTKLRRWEVVDPVVPIGPATFRGSWTQNGSTVVVTARPAPAIVPGATDFSLSLASAQEEA